MTRTQSIALAALIAIVAVAAGMLLSRTLLSPDPQGSGLALESGTVLTPPRPLPAAAFTDHRGEPFGDEQLRDRWSLLFFGFTSCPDICPMTLTILAQVETALADLPAPLRPQVVLVSVDPKRDTPEQLAKYVQFFSPSFVAVTAPQATLDEFTRQMGVPVGITPLGDDNYTVDHSAAVFAINPDGALRALFSPPHAAGTLAEDFRRLISTTDG